MFYPRCWVFLLALMLAIPALALVSDKDQPIQIESDSAEYREPEGLTIYIGNVRLTQGSILIQADRITLRDSEGELAMLVAEGAPAAFEQTVNVAGDRVIAQSNHMEYNRLEAILTLSEDARLTQQGGTTLSGNQIVYDVQRHVLRATSQGESSQDRVRVTIPPASLQDPARDAP